MTEKANNLQIFTKIDIIPIALIISLSLLSSWLIAPFIWEGYSLGDYASLYTLSALIQAFAALFALVGMFVIFKLQSIDNRMSATEHNIVEYIRKATDTVQTYGNILDLRPDIINPPFDLEEEIKEDLLILSKNESLMERFNELDRMGKQKSKIKMEFLKPL
ncbi:MAG: hypothetical protein GPJ50_01345, partial [Candidatus Heimdallarchaeota archaeon]|nr:hypothetical protein [Candidatus Heimdallarchaeota archaeon]